MGSRAIVTLPFHASRTIVAAFRAALVHQSFILLVLGLVLASGWLLVRTRVGRRRGRDTALASTASLGREPAARRLLRIGFGLLWTVDGLLQAQGAMPQGLSSQVVSPSVAGSPGWLDHLVAFGLQIWNNHPVEGTVATVWIQLGIGIWLLVAPRGRWSQCAGLAGAGWGLVVWVFGESLGGVLAPGLSWMTGAPGSVFFYVVAGVLIALPERQWHRARLGRSLLVTMGLFFVGSALLQAWPSQGSWKGPGSTLEAMVQEGVQTSQPHLFVAMLRAFGDFVAAHGFAVNLFMVILLTSIGVAFMTRRPTLVRSAVTVAVALAAADWVLVQDFGVFGGLATDPNSMIPMALLFVAGYLALTRAAVGAEEAVSPLDRRAAGADRSRPTHLGRVLVAAGAAGITLFGAIPMAVASMNTNADPIVARALGGMQRAENLPLPSFALSESDGRNVSPASFKGRVVLLEFVDPLCTAACPTIFQEFRSVDSLLGGRADDVELVAVTSEPAAGSLAQAGPFVQQPGVTTTSNWTYLTGSEANLASVWEKFGVQIGPPTLRTATSDLVYVIDGNERIRYVDNFTNDPGTASTKSSFAVLLAGQFESVLAK